MKRIFTLIVVMFLFAMTTQAQSGTYGSLTTTVYHKVDGEWLIAAQESVGSIISLTPGYVNIIVGVDDVEPMEYSYLVSDTHYSDDETELHYVVGEDINGKELPIRVVFESETIMVANDTNTKIIVFSDIFEME